MKQKYVIVLIGILLLINIYLFSQYFFKKNKNNPSKVISLTQSPSVIDNINKEESSLLESVSDITNTHVQITNKEQLVSIIKKLNVYEPNSVVVYSEKGMQKDLVTVNNLRVYITDKEQPLGQVFTQSADGKDTLLQAFGMKYDSSSKIYNLYLYINPEVIKNDSDKDLSRRYSYVFKYAVWDITHPLKPEHAGFEERLKGKNEFIQSNINDNWITIEKR